jgi:hypothetical protein
MWWPRLLDPTSTCEVRPQPTGAQNMLRIIMDNKLYVVCPTLLDPASTCEVRPQPTSAQNLLRIIMGHKLYVVAQSVRSN